MSESLLPIPLVGIDAIDAEHREFVRLLDRFNGEGTPDGETIGQMLAETLLYTETHFTNEEIVMQEAGYPLHADHKAMHDRAEAEMHRLAEDKASEEEIRHVLGRFILNWFLLHIRSADQKLANWLQETGTEYRPSAMEPLTTPCITRVRSAA
ncbi:bacteriohemerythrin [Azospirillum canadense]|uniref:bacteriohemerythrin n=1 Tax=Azospirillum canadense TaxID=403962 RepID=UPI00222662D1|nr:hemerythrin family protein [Azospirillum canadense]MCW2242283.1 hemerythrin [Azospirillum canadense]